MDSSHSNPGPRGGRAHARERASLEFGFDGASNSAPYLALLRGLEAALNLGITKLEVFGNNEVVIKQVAGAYSVSDARLDLLREHVKVLRRRLGRFEIYWTPKNLEANQLALHNLQRFAGLERRSTDRWFAEARGQKPASRRPSFKGGRRPLSVEKRPDGKRLEKEPSGGSFSS